MSDSDEMMAVDNAGNQPPSETETTGGGKGKRIILVIAILIAVITGCTVATSLWCGPSEEEKAEQKRRGKHCLDSLTLTWEIEEAIESRLNYPDSLDVTSLSISPVMENGNHRLTVEFKAQNAFGMVGNHRAHFRVPNEGCTEGEYEFRLIE